MLARDPPPPCLPCVRCLPSRSPSARAQARTVLPPSAHRLHPASQPARSPRPPRSSSCTPQRSPAGTHPSPAPALTHAHPHTSTPPRTHPHHTHTLSRHAPGRPHMPALLRCTHSNSNSEDSGICRRLDLRPMSYGSMEVLPVWAGRGVMMSGRSGEIGAGDARGQVGGSAAGTLGSAKKNAENSAFFFRKFCKVNIFAYICIEKNTKPIQL